MVQPNDDFVPVRYGTPAVFVDCSNTPLELFSWSLPDRSPNIINEKNKPNELIQMIATGKTEHRDSVLQTTMGLTVGGCLAFVAVLLTKFNSVKVYVHSD